MCSGWQFWRPLETNFGEKLAMIMHLYEAIRLIYTEWIPYFSTPRKWHNPFQREGILPTLRMPWSHTNPFSYVGNEEARLA
ncbi:hypothetical protein H5410_043048 [Solanum commersonii]|uniref:Uncharacterized protein n=1 Tax=Solanum commersonii TaxID=4109 RepID=A0A9J5Y0C7_SOLCO|nr:hypothetical protein H5410_043048 [Solanum commersonii]